MLVTGGRGALLAPAHTATYYAHPGPVEAFARTAREVAREMTRGNPPAGRGSGGDRLAGDQLGESGQTALGEGAALAVGGGALLEQPVHQ